MSSNASDFTVTQYKANPGQVNVNEAQGIVECFVAALGNKDSVGDICLPGCFNASLKRRKPRVVWGHNWNEPIGKVLEIYEVGPSDPRLPAKMRAKNVGGLFAKVQFNLMSEKGREAFSNVAFFGEEQEWSIGYKTLDAVFDTTQQANLLKEVELYEVSPVLHGANQLTATLSIKADDQESGGGMNQKFHAGVLYAPAETPQNPVTGRMGALARHINMHFGGEVVIRSAEENIVIFDLTRDGKTETLRAGYHSPNGVDFMFGAAQPVRAEVVYLPVDGSAGSRVAGQDESHGGCGCGGACGGTKSDCGCGGECAGCGVKDALPSWDDFKSCNPGTHLFVKTADGEMYEAALDVADYHGFDVELLSDGFAVPNIDWYDSEASNALIIACDSISEKAARPGRSARGLVPRSRRGVSIKPASYDGDNDGFRTGPTGLDNIPYVANPFGGTSLSPQNMPTREEPKRVPREIPEKTPIKKPNVVPRKNPQEIPQKEPQKEPIKEPQKEPVKEPIKEPQRQPKKPPVEVPEPAKEPQREPARPVPTPAPAPSEPTRTPTPDVPEPPGRKPKPKPKRREQPQPIFPGRTKPGVEPEKPGKPKRKPGPRIPIEPRPPAEPKPPVEPPKKPKPKKEPRPGKPKRPNPFIPDPTKPPVTPNIPKPTPERPRVPERPGRIPVPARYEPSFRGLWKSDGAEVFVSISDDKDMQVKSGLQFDTRDIDSVVVEVDVNELFELKSLIDPVLEYHGIDAEATEYGIQIFRYSQLTDEAISALSSVIDNF